MLKIVILIILGQTLVDCENPGVIYTFDPAVLINPLAQIARYSQSEDLPIGKSKSTFKGMGGFLQSFSISNAKVSVNSPYVGNCTLTPNGDNTFKIDILSSLSSEKCNGVRKYFYLIPWLISPIMYNTNGIQYGLDVFFYLTNQSTIGVDIMGGNYMGITYNNYGLYSKTPFIDTDIVSEYPKWMEEISLKLYKEAIQVFTPSLLANSYLKYFKIYLNSLRKYHNITKTASFDYRPLSAPKFINGKVFTVPLVGKAVYNHINQSYSITEELPRYDPQFEYPIQVFVSKSSFNGMLEAMYLSGSFDIKTNLTNVNIDSIQCKVTAKPVAQFIEGPELSAPIACEITNGTGLLIFNTVANVELVQTGFYDLYFNISNYGISEVKITKQENIDVHEIVSLVPQILATLVEAVNNVTIKNEYPSPFPYCVDMRRPKVVFTSDYMKIGYNSTGWYSCYFPTDEKAVD